ncbi:MAG: hypothetical protein M3171_07265, partial [Actinomycetota bacterium]|nr:hypothetical protein [Actinomycetota bacterium]
HFGWGLGGVWAGLAAFIGVRLVGMLWRARGDRWLVTGVTGRSASSTTTPPTLHGCRRPNL